MSYKRINFENKPSKKTPINAENLNHMEQGIVEAHEAASRKIPISDKGEPGGVASLDETGKVPEEQLPEIKAYESEGENSFATNDSAVAIGNYSFASGKNTVAGCRGYYIKSIDMTEGVKKIYLCKVKESNPKVDIVDNTDPSFETPAYTKGDKFNIINGSHYVLCGTITYIENNVITYEGDLGFTELVEDNDIEGHTFFVPKKPTVGVVVVANNNYAVGENAISVGRSGYAEGRDVLVAGNYGHAEGRQTIAGYAAHAEGMRSEALGLYSHAEGYNVRSKGNTTHAEGYDTEAQGDYSHTEGYQAKSIGEQSHAEGSSSESVGKASHAEGHNTHSIGEYSHAEGQESSSKGKGSHAEGLNTVSQGEYSHAEGNTTRSVGNHSHSEGESTHAEGQASHAEGYHTRATNLGAHAEGISNAANGQGAHAEGNSTEATADYAHAEGCDTVASAQAAHAEGYSCVAEGMRSHAEGLHSKAIGQVSHAEGYGVIAIGDNQHAQGKFNIVDEITDEYPNGKYAHIVGNGSAEDVVDESGNITKRNRSNAHTVDWAGNAWYAGEVYVGGDSQEQAQRLAKASEIVLEQGSELGSIQQSGSFASGPYSFAIGMSSKASGICSFAEGHYATAGGLMAHAEGCFTTALEMYSHAEGAYTNAYKPHQHVQGKYNLVDETKHYLHIVGNGSFDNNSNAHTVDLEGNAWYQGSVTSNGADYAEYFEWLDGNPDNEDRVGLLVTLDGDKIKPANVGDEVLGIVSGTAAVLGDNYECEWNGKYLTDDFGRIQYEEVEEFYDEIVGINEETNEPITEKKSLGFFKHPRLNPDYDPEQTYINRADRSEWTTVGMFGKIYVRDDGTAEVNGYIAVGENGVATKSEERTNMRVLSRINDYVIRVLLK